VVTDQADYIFAKFLQKFNAAWTRFPVEGSEIQELVETPVADVTLLLSSKPRI
jgi:hypothetical protein